MPKKLKSCVRKVKRRGIKNPWGICVASTGQKPHRRKSAHRKTRARRR